MNCTRFASALAMSALAAILLPSFLRAQITFQRTYGGERADYGCSVRQTADNGYVVAGHTLSFGCGGYDVYLIKTDVRGDAQWTRTFGDTAHDEGFSVQQTADGGYVIVGSTGSYGAGTHDVYFIKTDADGDTEWTKTFGGTYGDQGNSVQQTADGGYIIAGYTESSHASEHDVYVIKTDADGDTLWTRTFGGAGEELANSVQQTFDGGYIIAGGMLPQDSSHADLYLIRTDSNGDTLWTRTYANSNGTEGRAGQQTADSGFIIAGFRDVASGDVYLVKVAASGDTEWTRTFGGEGYDDAHSVQQTTDGGYIISGATRSFGAGGEDAWLIKTDAVGDTLWTRTFGDTADEGGWSIRQTADRGFIIAGYTGERGNDRSDVYLIKTDSLGNVAVEEPKASPTRASALSLTCEPNPCRSSTVVHLTVGSLDHSTIDVHVYDSQGRLVHSTSGVVIPSFPLDLRSLPSGAYFVRLDAGEEHATTRIVLQR